MKIALAGFGYAVRFRNGPQNFISSLAHRVSMEFKDNVLVIKDDKYETLVPVGNIAYMVTKDDTTEAELSAVVKARPNRRKLSASSDSGVSEVTE